MTHVQRLYILLCGYEIVDKTVSTRDRGERFVLCEPISAYLLATDAGYLLVDTGINTRIINDPQLCERFYTSRGWPVPQVRPHHELVFQLQQIGIQPQDVTRVILTHMHMDHTGNLALFPHARIAVQRAEYDYAFSPHHAEAWFEEDYAIPGLQWDVYDGDWEVLPGLQALATPGHTPGHQSLLVQLPSGITKVLVGDAGDLAENFAEEVLPGESVDDAAALASIRRLKGLAQQHNAELVLGHDPNYIQRVQLAPAWYD